jgi:hypothetical protein
LELLQALHLAESLSTISLWVAAVAAAVQDQAQVAAAEQVDF